MSSRKLTVQTSSTVPSMHQQTARKGIVDGSFALRIKATSSRESISGDGNHIFHVSLTHAALGQQPSHRQRRSSKAAKCRDVVLRNRSNT